MAHIQLRGYLSVKKTPSLSLDRPFVGQVSMSGSGAMEGTRSIPTTDVALDLGSIATIGYVMLHNTDATNYVQVGSDGTLYPIKLKAGEYAVVRWNAAAIHAKSNTAACVLDYVILED